MLVYRLEVFIKDHYEHPWVGPFTACVHNPQLEQSFLKYTRDLRFPVKEPRDDGIKFQHGMLCGFINAFQFEKWVHRFMFEYLGPDGFVIGVYEVPDHKVHMGKQQVAFYLTHATRTGEIACDDLVDLLTKDMYNGFNKVQPDELLSC